MATEDFTTANDPLTNSANWGAHTGTSLHLEAAGGVCIGGHGGGTDDESAYYVGTFADDQYAQVKLSTITVKVARIGPCLRLSTSSYPGILVRYKADTGTIECYYWSAAGSRTQVGSALTPSSTIATGDILKAEITGTTVTVSIDFTGVGDDFTVQTPTFTSASFPASGNPGLYMAIDPGQEADNDADDWEGGNLAAGGGIIPQAMNYYKQQQ